MPNLVGPCIHMDDCTWDCPRGTVYEAGQSTSIRTARGRRRRRLIQKITLHLRGGRDVVVDWEADKDVDLIVLSEEAFLNLVFPGVEQRQGRYQAERIAEALRGKPALGS